MKLDSLRRIGIINTLRMNFHYFGWVGIIRPYILASKFIYIRQMEGQIKCTSNSIGSIRIGIDCPGVVDYKMDRCVWENSGVVEVEGKTYLGAGTKIVNHGVLYLGNNSAITGNTSILCYKKITIGDNSIISWDCQLSDTDFHKILSAIDGKHKNEDREIIIQNNVWIGSRCTILKGSVIPVGSVIAAGSVINKELQEESAIYVSNKIAKQNIKWEK